VQLDLYAGTYYSRELETTYKLSIENGKLVGHHMRLGDFNLDPDIAIADKFSSHVGALIFYKNNQNKIAGFRLSGGRVRNILFEKQP
jgi:hypothetical protein